MQKHVAEDYTMANGPFLIKFAHVPLDKGIDSGTAGLEQGANEKTQAQLPDTFITKVDRETTDDR